MEHVTPEQVSHILQQHRQFFHSGHTRNVKFRLEQLRKLADAIRRYERLIMNALHQDLRKNEFEAYTTHDKASQAVDEAQKGEAPPLPSLRQKLYVQGALWNGSDCRPL